MRLSTFQDAAANSRSALKPDLGTSVHDKRSMLMGLCNRGDDHAKYQIADDRKNSHPAGFSDFGAIEDKFGTGRSDRFTFFAFDRIRCKVSARPTK
jgi:hypothetical protein